MFIINEQYDSNYQDVIFKHGFISPFGRFEIVILYNFVLILLSASCAIRMIAGFSQNLFYSSTMLIKRSIIFS